MEPALSAAFARLHPTVVGWGTEAELRRALFESVEFHVDRHLLRRGAETNHRLAARPNTTIDDFFPARLDFGPGRSAFVSLRFRGGWQGPAYVETDLWTFTPESPDYACRLAEFALKRYAALDVTELRVLHPPDASFSPAALSQAFPDQDVYAGRIDELVLRPAPPTAREIRLEALTDTSFLPEYAREYEQLHASSPFHAREVSPQSESDVEAAVAARTFFEIRLGEQSAGWIGVRSLYGYDEVPLPGWEVLEEFVRAEFRGRGLATIAQRRLIEHLAERTPGRSRVLVGVIHPENHASVRTAEHNGRIRVGCRTFVGGAETPPG